MYCMDNCLEQKLCRKADLRQQQLLADALEQLQQAIVTTHASLDNCFVFTLENRNCLMNKIADVKKQASHFGCSHLMELTTLAEIITMVLFRSHHYRDHQGLAQIEDAVKQMQICFVTKTEPQGQKKSIAETVERLWRWVDTNAVPGVQHL